MSPRKSHFRIPEWQVKLYRAEGKKMLFGPYICPKCKLEKLKININKQKKEVIATCDCGLECSLKYVVLFDPVDYYSVLIDKFHEHS